jgi:hypothetical protein
MIPAVSPAARSAPPSRIAYAGEAGGELHAALAHVNAWLSAHAVSFSPLTEKDGKRLAFRMKAFVELCLYQHLAERLGSTADIPKALSTLAAECVFSEGFRDILLYSPLNTATYMICALPYRGTDAFREIAAYYKTVCRPLGNEQLPFQLLGQLYVHDMLGLYDEEAAALEAHALSLSALYNVPSSLATAAEEPYSLTHSAFYATRFGDRELPLTPSQAESLSTYMDIELAKSFTQKNIDGALEIVLARLCVFGAVSAADRIVFESALSLIGQKGYLLTPKISETPIFDDAREHDWEKSYHTMIVMGLLIMKLRGAPLALDAADDERKEKLAIAMDAVGTIYTAVEQGNLALAVFILSKLDDLAPQVFPSERVLAPVLAYVRSLERIRRSRDDARGLRPADETIQGMPIDDFLKVTSLFEETATRLDARYRGH